jgi:hypothetical protein
MYQRGGMSLNTGKGFKSLWLYDLDIEKNLAFTEIISQDIPDLIAADVVKFMKERGFLPVERVKLQYGSSVTTHFASGEQLVELKQKKKVQREKMAAGRLKYIEAKKQAEDVKKEAQIKLWLLDGAWDNPPNCQ